MDSIPTYFRADSCKDGGEEDEEEAGTLLRLVSVTVVGRSAPASLDSTGAIGDGYAPVCSLAFVKALSVEEKCVGPEGNGEAGSAVGTVEGILSGKEDEKGSGEG